LADSSGAELTSMTKIYQIFHIYQIKNLYTKHFENGIYIYTSWQHCCRLPRNLTLSTANNECWGLVFKRVYYIKNK